MTDREIAQRHGLRVATVTAARARLGLRCNLARRVTQRMRVAEMHAAGLCNRLIAAALHMSGNAVRVTLSGLGLRAHADPGLDTTGRRVLRATVAAAKVGQRIRNVDLAERLGVSRGVVAVHRHRLRKRGLLPELRA